jgi:hypothetical protein
MTFVAHDPSCCVDEPPPQQARARRRWADEQQITDERQIKVCDGYGRHAWPTISLVK